MSMDERLLGLRYDDYINMFDLSDDDLDKSILDCQGGGNEFSLKMARAKSNFSCIDELFCLEKEEFSNKIDEIYLSLSKFLNKDKNNFQQDKIKPWIDNAKDVVDQYKHSYDALRQKGSLKFGKLPNLELEDSSFDIALCSHFLFTFEDSLYANYITDSLKELCRVAIDVRVFPLVDMKGNLSQILPDIMQALQADGYGVELKVVKMEFQKDANTMLRVWGDVCELKKK